QQPSRATAEDRVKLPRASVRIALQRVSNSPSSRPVEPDHQYTTDTEGRATDLAQWLLPPGRGDPHALERDQTQSTPLYSRDIGTYPAWRLQPVPSKDAHHRQPPTRPYGQRRPPHRRHWEVEPAANSRADCPRPRSQRSL